MGLKQNEAGINNGNGNNNGMGIGIKINPLITGRKYDLLFSKIIFFFIPEVKNKYINNRVKAKLFPIA